MVTHAKTLQSLITASYPLSFTARFPMGKMYQTYYKKYWQIVIASYPRAVAKQSVWACGIKHGSTRHFISGTSIPMIHAVMRLIKCYGSESSLLFIEPNCAACHTVNAVYFKRACEARGLPPPSDQQIIPFAD